MMGGTPVREERIEIGALCQPREASLQVDVIAEMQQPMMVGSGRRRAEAPQVDSVLEMRRGIAEATGLYGSAYPSPCREPSQRSCHWSCFPTSPHRAACEASSNQSLPV